MRTLREEATQAEKSKFMSHLLPIQSDKRHENVVSLVGVSLNAPPFLAVLEFCGVGDLKTFLQNATGIDYHCFIGLHYIFCCNFTAHITAGKM